MKQRPTKWIRYAVISAVVGSFATFESAAMGGAPVTSSDSASVVRGSIGKSLDAHLNRMVKHGYSGAVIVAKGGDMILRKGYGCANRKKNLPVVPETVFTIWSISKQFTGAAIVKDT